MAALGVAALTLAARSAVAARSFPRFGANRRLLGAALEQSSLKGCKLAATSPMADRPSLVVKVGKRR
jgi:hypothetical protein